MRPRWPAPRRQVRGPTRSAEEAEEERGPRGTRAQDAGARRPRVSTQAGAVRLAPCKCPLALRSWEKGRGEGARARVVRFPRVLRVTWDSPTGGGAEAGVGLVASPAPGCRPPPPPLGFRLSHRVGETVLNSVLEPCYLGGISEPVVSTCCVCLCVSFSVSNHTLYSIRVPGVCA